MSDLLRRLTSARGVSGDEGDIRKVIIDEITPLVDEVHIDRMGNVKVTRKVPIPNAK